MSTGCRFAALRAGSQAAASANVRSILRELCHALGTTVVTVTHDTGFAAAADRSITLVDGRIVVPDGAQ